MPATITPSVIERMCGSDRKLLRYFHHGIFDLPLAPFYPQLNLEEIAGFAVGFWDLKNKSKPENLDTLSTYQLFAVTYDQPIALSPSFQVKNAFHWLNTRNQFKENGSATDRQKKKYQQLNPYGRDLEQRLEKVAYWATEMLKQSLQEEPTKFITEQEYDTRRILTREYEPNIVIVTNSVDYYTREISRKLNIHPSSRITPEELQQILLAEAQNYFPGLNPEEAKKAYGKD